MNATASHAPRQIALFIDGTWNAPWRGEDTNVRQLFEWSLVPDAPGAPKQVCGYLPGVGEDMADAQIWVNALPPPASLTSTLRPPGWLRRLVKRAWNAGAGGVGGWGTAMRIQAAYAFLCSYYRPGDRVHVFGFSRGAFAARSLAGFVSRIGVLLANRIDQVPEAYRLYELAPDRGQAWLAEHMRRLELRVIEGTDDDASLPIHFLGVWDTVGALGLPRRLSVFSAPFTEHHQVDVPPNVFAARHAMALHELRPDFDLMLWSNPARHPDLVQAWFPGDHADVGGGHAPRESGYADEALNWMAVQARQHGLRLGPQAPPRRSRRLHQQWGWFLINSPTQRPATRELARYTGPAWDHACHCHVSVDRHLQDGAGARYRYPHAGLRRALGDADATALALWHKAVARGLVV